MNPVISPVKENGKQEIGVHDYKSGNRRYLEVDKDKVDAFINTREKKLNKVNIATAIVGLASFALGALAHKNSPCKSQSHAMFSGVFWGGASGALFNAVTKRIVDKSVTDKFIEENK